MIKTAVIHPQILEALAGAGHGGKVLIADGDYPVSTTKGINAKVVHLNLVPGKMKGTEVLEALMTILPIEKVQVMDVPSESSRPEIWDIYEKMLKENHYDITMGLLERFEFYKEVSKESTALMIQTGETREYSNLLLTIGSLW